ncbi:hypothetical protein DNTS_020212 [Danionella cerebrum]|uniref:KASH5-like coiled-coil domain-containing protein n=1 Tax=Danionella cerebrum TaxID=2873325 RepID=A0A553N9Z1_9TELE|nr:hypothetical protein DNTS_020212 [Danionella translucida]
MDIGVAPRRHNPVDSICRKLQTIQRRDQEVNSPFQIPKFQSNSYDSPHSGLRLNLEAILKKRAGHNEGDSDCDSSAGMLTPTASPGPGSTSSTPLAPITPANATYTVSSTLGALTTIGDKRPTPRNTRAFQGICSTPAAGTGDTYFNFTPRYSTQTQVDGLNTEGRSSRIPTPGLFSYNLNLSSDISTMKGELNYPVLVVKRLSFGEGSRFPSEPKKESLAEVSLICKVCVSHIMDFLRHTICRNSEDSGLEELCNMLDPEQKDISIDLDTYHAIMKEWIDDCRNQGKESKNDTQQEPLKLLDSLSARRSAFLNMTSGSLEAFGGEASSADLETSDLVFCVADLQLNNQKLQEEVRKLKQAVENMEDTNQKLIEENEELKAQAKIGQQSLQKEKLLKEEVEEMKQSLSSSEDSRSQASAQRKQMERENQSLISKMADLQEENLKVTLEAEELQKKMTDLFDLNADLQIQIHSFDAVLADKEAVMQEKMKLIDELKAAIVEYSSVTEYDSGLSLSVAYRLNQMSSGSLQTELALAQTPLEKREFKEDDMTFLTVFRSFTENSETQETNADLKIQGLEVQLEQRRSDWTRTLEQLDQYTDSLERELLKMASNMRRSRTDILHLSVKLQEQESQKQQLQEELERLKPLLNSREISSQTDPLPQIHKPDECDEKHMLSESLPPEELKPDEKILQEHSDEKETHGLKHEDQEKEETEATQDSGVQTEDLQQGFIVSLAAVSDSGTHKKSEETSVVTDGVVLTHCVLEKEEDKLPEYTWQEDAHGKAAPLPHTHNPCDAPSGKDQISNNEPSTLVTPEMASLSPSPLEGVDSITGRLGSQQLVAANKSLAEEVSIADMSDIQDSFRNLKKPRPDEGELSAVSSISEKSVLLRVSEGMPDGVDVISAGGEFQDKDKTVVTLDSSLPTFPVSSEDLEKVKVTLDPAVAEGDLPPVHSVRKDHLIIRNKLKKEVSSMEAIEEQKAQEVGEPLIPIEREGDQSHIPESVSSSTKDEKNSLSPNDKEIEAEFHRLSLGFKCDSFTMEKRLRLEERSRDLAEDNIRKEVNGCKDLLEALLPRCEDDNQSMEIIHRLQKNLEILVQSMTRVSSRSEMLGAIHQSWQNSGDDFRNKKQTASNIFKTKDTAETEMERHSRRSPWKRPTLKRFISSGAWADVDEPRLRNRCGFDSESLSEEEQKEEPVEERSATPSPTDRAPPSLMEGRPAALRGPRGVWMWVPLLLVLAVLLALLASLMLQPAVDAAPVGTGDSWMTIQQLLWPYAGLRHNGQPPV